MNEPFVFISCGQFTKAEKSLGTAIADIVETLTPYKAFFAEDVHDLNGLNDNILGALRDCAGLIVVLHPRGTLPLPDGTPHVRASVWIEQEIAIAAYIRSGEKRSLPVIAFTHQSVGLEGIRTLLHLNPTAFTTEAEVLAQLPKRLKDWGALSPRGIRVELSSEKNGFQDGHPIRRLSLNVVNETNTRITSYDGVVQVPTVILKHWSASYYGEDMGAANGTHRFFRFNEAMGAILPRSTLRLYATDYCLKCGVDAAGGVEAVVTNSTVKGTLWSEDRPYEAKKTVMDLRPADEV